MPPTRYSDLAALVGETSDNLPGVPGVGPKTAAKWITQYGDLDGHRRRASTRSRARRASPCASTSTRCCATAASTSSSTTPGRRRRSTTSSAAQWDREEVHTVFDGLEFRVLRDRLFADRRGGRSPRPSRASTSTATCSPRPRCRPGSPSTCRPAQRAGLSVAGTWARGTGDAERRRRRRARRQRRVDRPHDPDARGRGGRSATGSRTPQRPKAMHDAKGPIAGARRPRLDARRADERHPARRLPRQARPAHLSPRRPRRCATCTAS